MTNPEWICKWTFFEKIELIWILSCTFEFILKFKKSTLCVIWKGDIMKSVLCPTMACCFVNVIRHLDAFPVFWSFPLFLSPPVVYLSCVRILSMAERRRNRQCDIKWQTLTDWQLWVQSSNFTAEAGGSFQCASVTVTLHCYWCHYLPHQRDCKRRFFQKLSKKYWTLKHCRLFWAVFCLQESLWSTSLAWIFLCLWRLAPGSTTPECFWSLHQAWVECLTICISRCVWMLEQDQSIVNDANTHLCCGLQEP